MKQLLYALLLLATHQSLYLMDAGEIQLNENDMDGIMDCIGRCEEMPNHASTSFRKTDAIICSQTCNSIYLGRVEQKLKKEQTQTLLEQFKKAQESEKTQKKQ